MCDEGTLRKIFDQFDKDKSGQIDNSELKAVLKAYFDETKEDASDKRVEETADAIMKELDSSGDGKISFDEFKKAFK